MKRRPSRRRHLTPVSLRRVIPVSLWSGILTLNKAKEAEVSLEIPQFNGTLRLMAVAIDGDKVGAVQDKRIVRDPVVLTPTFPRFVAPGDKFTVPVSVFNGTGKTASSSSPWRSTAGRRGRPGKAEPAPGGREEKASFSTWRPQKPPARSVSP